jgi:hypothetical protein
VAVNLVPLGGVLYLGWSTFDLMVLYWLERGIVGLFALLTILLTRGRGRSRRRCVRGGRPSMPPV